VIPLLILAGIVVGRWWSIPLAMVAWPALLIGTGTGSDLSVIAGASLIAVPNGARGVGLHRVIRRLWSLARHARSRGARSDDIT
jgi:hypothetical protein